MEHEILTKYVSYFHKSFFVFASNSHRFSYFLFVPFVPYCGDAMQLNNIKKMALCYNKPDCHPFITDEEKKYLRDELGQTANGKAAPKTPWRQILTSVPFIALILCQVSVKEVYIQIRVCACVRA